MITHWEIKDTKVRYLASKYGICEVVTWERQGGKFDLALTAI